MKNNIITLNFHNYKSIKIKSFRTTYYFPFPLEFSKETIFINSLKPSWFYIWYPFCRIDIWIDIYASWNMNWYMNIYLRILSTHVDIKVTRFILPPWWEEISLRILHTLVGIKYAQVFSPPDGVVGSFELHYYIISRILCMPPSNIVYNCIVYCVLCTFKIRYTPAVDAIL